MSESALIVIPARMASTRFPGKPMAVIAGKPMLQRVWEIGKAVKGAHDVVIATDHEGLKQWALSFGANVVMTSSSCLTGTDRVAETALAFDRHSIFFSLQGDAVLTPPWVVEAVLAAMLNDATIQIATPAVRLQGDALREFVAGKQEGSSSGTAVVFNRSKDALYFSKMAIPYHREALDPDRILYRHIGLYGYRKPVLERLSRLPEGPLEQSEKLEQLRALEHGIPIRVIEVDYRGRTHGSVDRPEDVGFVESVIRKEGELL